MLEAGDLRRLVARPGADEDDRCRKDLWLVCDPGTVSVGGVVVVELGVQERG